MMPRHGYNYRLKVSLERALGILGDSSKQVLMFYITRQCGISFEKCSLSEIEEALKSVLGSGSAIITERMYRELESLPE